VSNLDLEDVELRTSLRLLLTQVQLAYTVRDGMIVITSEERLEPAPRPREAAQFQIVGRCLIAVIAAVLGGLAAPLVCELGRQSTSAIARDSTRGGTS
jgi:hypothetical protein